MARILPADDREDEPLGDVSLQGSWNRIETTSV